MCAGVSKPSALYCPSRKQVQGAFTVNGDYYYFFFIMNIDLSFSFFRRSFVSENGSVETLDTLDASGWEHEDKKSCLIVIIIVFIILVMIALSLLIILDRRQRNSTGWRCFSEILIWRSRWDSSFMPRTCINGKKKIVFEKFDKMFACFFCSIGWAM